MTGRQLFFFCKKRWPPLHACTLARSSGVDDAAKFNRGRRRAASTVCEIFHDFGGVNTSNKNRYFTLLGKHPISLRRPCRHSSYHATQNRKWTQRQPGKVSRRPPNDR